LKARCAPPPFSEKATRCPSCETKGSAGTVPLDPRHQRKPIALLPGEVHALREEGRSWRAIAQALKVPRRTLERAYRLAHNVEPGNEAAH
jgi:hypothetical protein